MRERETEKGRKRERENKFSEKLKSLKFKKLHLFREFFKPVCERMIE